MAKFKCNNCGTIADTEEVAKQLGYAPGTRMAAMASECGNCGSKDISQIDETQYATESFKQKRIDAFKTVGILSFALTFFITMAVFFVLKNFLLGMVVGGLIVIGLLWVLRPKISDSLSIKENIVTILIPVILIEAMLYGFGLG